MSKNFFRSEYEFKQELVLGIIQKYAMFAAAAPSHLIFTLEGRDAILDNYQVQSTMLGTAKQAVRYNYVCELKKLYWNDGIRWKQKIQESGNLVPTSPTSSSLAKKLHLFMMAKGRDYMTPSVSSIELIESWPWFYYQGPWIYYNTAPALYYYKGGADMVPPLGSL